MYSRFVLPNSVARFVILVLIVVGFANSASLTLDADTIAKPMDGLPCTLIWHDSQELEGQLLSADSQVVRFQSDRFVDPFEFEHRYLRAIRCQHRANENGPASDEQGPIPAETNLNRNFENSSRFRVATLVGDILYGDLTGLDASTIRLQSRRHGEILLRRDQVREVSQQRFAKVLFDGPQGNDGWLVLKVGRRLDEWDVDPLGRLSTKLNGAEIFHALPHVDRAEMQVDLSWTDRPGFQVDIGSISELQNRTPRLSLKSWGDDVVVQSAVDASEFVHLLKLTKQHHGLKLRVIWDHPAGKAVIHDWSGLRLGEIAIPKMDTAAPDPTAVPDGLDKMEVGVLVRNRGSQLGIDLIRLSEYSGRSHAADPQHEPFVRLGDGKVLTDRPQSLDQATGLLSLESGEQVALADIALMELVASQERIVSPLEVRFRDGTHLSGELVSIDQNTLVVRSKSSQEPIPCQLDGLRELMFPDAVDLDPAAARYVLTWNDHRSNVGQLKSSDATGSLGWQPAGSRTASAVGTELPFQIDLMGSDAHLLRPPLHEIAHLRDGTMLVGQLEKIDRHQAWMMSEYAGRTEIPTDQIKAIEVYGAAGRVDFTSPNWDFFRGVRPAQQSRGSLTVTHQVSFRDLALTHRGRVSFQCAWDEDFLGIMTIHMGTSTQASADSSVVRLMFQQQSLTVRCLQHQASHREFQSLYDRRATVSLRGEGRDLMVWVNGELAFHAVLNRPIPDTGLWFQCGSAKSPATTDRAREPGLLLDSVRVGPGAGLENLGLVEQSQKQVFLQIPRTKSPELPEHVMCAMNGDMLRGTLQSLDAAKVTFQSRDSELTVPREQLAAIIWLDPPALDKVETGDPRPITTPSGTGIETIEDDSLQFTMDDGSSLRLRTPRLDATHLRGTHRLLGEVAIPLTTLVRVRDPETRSESPFADWVLTRSVNSENALQNEPSKQGEGETGTDSPLVGRRLEVAIPLLDGDKLSLPQTDGKIVILDFWASWNAPCVRTLPSTYEFIQTLPADQVTYVAVNQGEALPIVTAFSKLRNWGMNIGMDTQGQLAKLCLVRNIPQTIIVGRDGHVSHVFLGSSRSVEIGFRRSVRQSLGFDPDAGDD